MFVKLDIHSTALTNKGQVLETKIPNLFFVVIQTSYFLTIPQANSTLPLAEAVESTTSCLELNYEGGGA